MSEKRGHFVTPTGRRLRGTLESLTGTAEVSDVVRKDDGTIEIEWSGYTQVWWDGQETATENGQRLWVDSEGETWPEDKLIFVEGAP
ncbi:MAG: hypothetical protein KIS74_02945 [Burkholderiales bacterium]|nr:hypothetical protein [Burkholderiales bacterium]